MTATLADIGYNSAFGIEGGSPAAFTDVAEITAVTAPGLTRAAVEATHLKSPDRTKEFIPGLFERGEATFTLTFEKDVYDTILTAATAVDGGRYRITLPDGSTFTFNGFFTGLTSPEATPEGKLECQGTIKPKGTVTYAAAA
ncbi:phage tail tube protein [Roseicyclus marinus]|uniref:phage tail tube protein n=1 Tax=Roseicyclus marinus TaxID=2161673 RepID=UPI00240F5FC4|nr:phage tail tube protein [Roseicyclus marinus]MDG3040438.1 phage tail tube protein [Roseicyclus marinus]